MSMAPVAIPQSSLVLYGLFSPVLCWTGRSEKALDRLSSYRRSFPSQIKTKWHESLVLSFQQFSNGACHCPRWRCVSPMLLLQSRKRCSPCKYRYCTCSDSIHISHRHHGSREVNQRHRKEFHSKTIAVSIVVIIFNPHHYTAI